MVKPPKTMEPSSIKDMSKAGRDRQKAFGDDSFHVYMARKIDMQRRQFGCMQLPPSPLAFYSSKNMSERLHAQNDGQSPTFQPKSYIDKGVNSGQQFTFELIDSNPNHPPSPPPPPLPPIKKFGVDAVVKRLQRRHGVIDNNHSSSFVTSSIDKMSRKRRRTENTSDRAVMMLSQDEKVISSGEDRDYDGCNIALPMEINRNKAENCSLLENPIHTSDHDAQNIDVRCSTEKQRTPTLRPDLFFFGIVVLINGYTDPDAATLQRLLQKHGGDVEKYETTRITHIIAERLSHAKANVYKKQQRNPKPVCHTKWITDSVQAYKLLPYQNYILEDVKKEKNLRSVASMFQKQNTTSIDTTNAVAKETDSTKDLQSNTKYRIDSNTSNLNETYNSKDRISNEVTIESISTDSEQPRSKMSPTSCSNLDRYDGGDHDKAHPSHSLQHTEESAVPICQELHSFTRSKMEERYIHGNIRTVGTDPNFLESFFASSRLSFIGSYRQRQQQQKQSPSMKRDQADATSATLERFIFHVDMDCFFASVVLRKYPQYKDQPVAISHNSDTTDHGARQLFKDSTSECATCNYEARKFGIKKGMFLSRAKVLCPNLIVLPYDYEGYEEVSDIVSDILDRHAAEFNGYVEHVSCDEAYMEIFIPSNGSKSPNVVAADVAEAIRTEISSMTQCTASVGVAANKFLAKLATDHIKPNRSFVMDDCRAILKTVKLRDLYGIGYKMGQRLEDEGLFSVHDIWDLGDTAETELCQILGVGLGKKIYGYCYGKDDRGMQASERKTIGAECNYGVRFDGPYGVDHMMEGLCKEVEKRMTGIGVRGLKVTLKVKQRKTGAPPPPKYLGHGSCHNLSKSAEVRTREATRNWKAFYEVAMVMYHDLKIEKDDVRGMGIVISKLVNDVSDALQESNAAHSFSKWFDRHSIPKNDGKSLRKVDFTFPARTTGNLGVTENVDDVEDSDIVYMGVNKNLTPRNDVGCNDIMLPALSQIHMSQVNALPSPMRKEIVAKMDKGKNRVVSVADDLTNIHHEGRYRQIDVKRMLRLASVKAGEAALVNEAGQAISLTQLDCLPLEMQLEIANGDSNGYGQTSPIKKSQNGRKFDSNTRTELVAKTSTTSQPIHGDDSEPSLNDATIDHMLPNFFRDNVMPLINYMNENPAADMISLQHVSTFLCICVEENRLSDTVVLLQMIRKHSNDRWSKEGFNMIFDTVDNCVLQHFRANLDKMCVL